MFRIMQNLLNGLEALRRSFSKTQINMKLLDRMPKIWEPKRTVITKAKNLKKLTWDELLGILRVHEVHL